VLAGAPVNLHMVTQPCYILSTVEDHIAPWKSTYAATQHYKSDKIRFVLSASGHVAGIVNPADKGKYGHWTAGDLKAGQYPSEPDAWFKTAKQVNKSWWIDWNDWIVREGYNGEKVPARVAGSARNKPLCDAPGTYVFKMS
jgi:polyhydroxyalkanoate synthase subunit PhaC